ncbi:MAG: bifunctional riboflavin kinase/FAD synthetase [Gloeobacteraceae cyanobacterium ES-bin-316]|nr:bifunctional riboflavin kinase/FAD synthetase [Ferruginibacter sp.]
MKVYKNIDQLPVFTNAVLTIGTFDGVHKGHQQIIQQLLKEAREINGTAVLISFYPHPKQVVANTNKSLSPASDIIQLLNSAEEKHTLLQQQGIEHIVVVPFDEKFAGQTATSYVKNFLVDLFHPHTIIIGYDHRFGNKREGDYQLLEAEALKNNFLVKEIPEHVLKNITISSTKIRTALLEGDIETAANYLGYAYFFSGKVVKGNQLGRTIGFPTANLLITDEQKLVPANGVYAVNVQHKQKTYKGMMNIGIRPTVDGITRTIEVNIFDFDETIYEEKLTITLIKYLRKEIKFKGLEELKAQLAVDKETALAAF